MVRYRGQTIMTKLGSTKSSFQWLIAAAIAILIATIPAPAVQAHASLLRSDPADGANLAESPREIHLWFDETISPQFSSAQLFDSNSQPVEISGVQADPDDPTLLILTLPELPSGVYSVLWKVLSGTDGHFSQGLLVFGVGETGDPGAAVAIDAKTLPPPVPEVILRWFNFSLLAGLVGAMAMVFLVLAPSGNRFNGGQAVDTIRHLARQRVLAWAGWCAGLALVVGVGLLIWQAIALLGTLPAGTSFQSVGWQMLAGTHWGSMWLIRQIVLLALTSLLFWLYRSSRNRHGAPEMPRHDGAGREPSLPKFPALLTGLLLLVLVVVQALTSHAAALTLNTTLALVVDAVHLLAASLWLGGLLALVIGLLPLIRRQTDRPDFTALVQASWRPFSRVAAVSVFLLIATGLYSTGRQVASVDALITSLYGQALLGKISLMLMVSALGLFNSMLLHPTLAAPLAWLLRRPVGWTPWPVRKLPTLVLIEVSLGLFVFLITGLVTAAPAPRGPEYTVAPEEVPTALSQTVDDVVVTLLVKPNRPGQNVFTVFAASIRRPPPAEILRIIVRFTFLGQEMGRVSAKTEEVEPGRFLVTGNYLSLAGPWQIDVVVRRKGVEDSVARFDWLVAPPGATRPVLISKHHLEPILTGMAAVAILLILLVTASMWFGVGNIFTKLSFLSKKNTHQDENEVILEAKIDPNHSSVGEYRPNGCRAVNQGHINQGILREETIKGYLD